MKLQKIDIEIFFHNELSCKILKELFETKYSKIRFEHIEGVKYLLKGMDKHREKFINDLLKSNVLHLSYKVKEHDNEKHYYFLGTLVM